MNNDTCSLKSFLNFRYIKEKFSKINRLVKIRNNIFYKFKVFIKIIISCGRNKKSKK